MSSLEETNVVGGGLVVGKGKEEAVGHEEKKDGASFVLVETTEHSLRPNGFSSAAGGRGLDHDEKHDEEPDFVDSLSARRFESLDELHDTLEELGLSDLKFKLDENGFAVIPGRNHNSATDYLHDKVDAWSKGWFGRWGKVCNDNVMQVPGHTRTGRVKQREPDVAFWGYPLCEKLEDTYVPKMRPDGANFNVDPDVAFQFSYGNDWDSEEDAMNLIMVGGIGIGNQGPRVGFLIKVRLVSGNAVGLDIYKVPRGRTVADAINQINGATHMVYTHGQVADVTIEISPEAGRFRDILRLASTSRYSTLPRRVGTGGSLGCGIPAR